jgi:hypothetical protein
MDPFIKAISSKVLEMDMVYGKVLNKMEKSTKVITCSIKNMVMVSTIGVMATSTRVHGWTISAMAKVYY